MGTSSGGGARGVRVYEGIQQTQGGEAEEDDLESFKSTDRLLGESRNPSTAWGKNSTLLHRLRRRFPAPSQHSSRSPAVTFGILIHCAVDGIALGAISAAMTASEQSQDLPNAGRAPEANAEASQVASSLELIVFFAIILHKVPSAFGLAAFLIRRGVSRPVIRKHLTVFSAAAPLSALLTYLLLIGSSRLESEDLERESRLEIGSGLSDPGPVDRAHQGQMGLCLLFSGGTFFYTIAVHILPHLQSPSISDPPLEARELNAAELGKIGSSSITPPDFVSPKDPSRLAQLLDLGVLVGGMLLPLLF